MTKLDPPESVDPAWIEALGQVAYLFGQIEMCSFWLIRRLVPSPEMELAMKDLQFSQRTKLARALAAQRFSVDAPKLHRAWDGLFDQALKVAKLRNDVLHNPLVLGVFEDAATQTYRVESRLQRMRKPDEALTLAEVKDVIHRLRKVASELANLISETVFYLHTEQAADSPVSPKVRGLPPNA